MQNVDETEQENRKTIIRSMSHHINKKLERIGNKLKRMNEQEKYEYFNKLIQNLERKLDYTISNEAWKRGVVKGCIKIYGEKPDYLNDTKNHLRRYAEYELENAH